MDFHSKKVLVTGSHSFTGKHLINQLHQHGFQVFGLDSHGTETPDHFVCDITNYDKLRNIVDQVQPSYIVHLAAITFVPHGNDKEIYDVNLFGTLNLLKALVDCGVDVQKVLIPSSSNVYGSPDCEQISEEMCPAPISHYANSKLAMEHMTKAYMDKLPILITRPFNYTGVGQTEKFLIPKIVEHFKCKKKVIELGNTDVTRDFSDVRFVVDAYCKLLTSEQRSIAINICSGKGYSLDEVIDFMNSIAGYQIEVKVNPQFVRENEIKILIGSNKLLHDTVSGLSTIPLKDTLAWMYHSQ